MAAGGQTVHALEMLMGDCVLINICGAELGLRPAAGEDSSFHSRPGRSLLAGGNEAETGGEERRGEEAQGQAPPFLSLSLSTMGVGALLHLI